MSRWGQCAARKRHQVWAKACEISEAYVVGKAESQAALHLYNDVSPRIALRLLKLVQHLNKTSVLCVLQFWIAFEVVDRHLLFS